MKDFTSDWCDGLPDGVPRNVLRIPQRFRDDWSTRSVSTALYSTQENDDIQQSNRRRKPKSNQPAQKSDASTLFRTHAASDALSYSWKFIKVCEQVPDVDTRKYPYELVRWEYVANREEMENQQLEPTKIFLNCFNSDYIRAAMANLRGISVDGSLTVSACFGRTLFRLRSLGSYRSYRWDELRDIRYPSDVRSSWSNICDEKVPAMRSLIDAVNNVSPEERKQELKITVHFCLAIDDCPQFAKVTFVHQHGRWVFRKTKALLDEYACHDIMLKNHTSFRVKIFYEQSAEAKGWWSSIYNLVQFHESRFGDPFATKVTLDPRASNDLSIKNVSIDSVHETVELCGLRFQISTKKDKVSLTAPSTERSAGKQASI